MQLGVFQSTVLASVLLLPGVLLQSEYITPMGVERHLYCSICQALVDEVLHALSRGIDEVPSDDAPPGAEDEVTVEVEDETAVSEDKSKPSDLSEADFNKKLDGILTHVCGKGMENYGLIRSRGLKRRPKMGVVRIKSFAGADLDKEHMGADEQTWDVFKAYCLSLKDENKKYMMEIFKMKHLSNYELRMELCDRTAKACQPQEVKDPDKKTPEEPRKSKMKRRRPRRKRRGMGKGRKAGRGRKRGSRRRMRRRMEAEDEHDDIGDEEWPRHRPRRSRRKEPPEEEIPDEELTEHELEMRREIDRRQAYEDSVVYHNDDVHIPEDEDEDQDYVDEDEFLDDLEMRRERRRRRKRRSRDRDFDEDPDFPRDEYEPLDSYEDEHLHEDFERESARSPRSEEDSSRKYDEL